MSRNNSFSGHSLEEYFSDARKEKSPMSDSAVGTLIQAAGKHALLQKRKVVFTYLASACALLLCILVFLFQHSKDQHGRAGMQVQRVYPQQKHALPAIPDKPYDQAPVPVVMKLANDQMKLQSIPVLSDVTYSFSAGIGKGVLPISLSGYELGRLGIDVVNKKICLANMNVCLDKEGVQSFGLARADSFPVPLLITDDEGNYLQSHLLQNSKITGASQVGDSFSNAAQANLLVPVLVCGEGGYSEIDKESHCFKPDIICWYAPNDTFFERLPARYRQGLQKNYDQITGKATDNSSCEYFEVCKNTLAPFGDVLVYPDPVQKEFNLRVRVEKEKNVRIVLFDINGKQVMVLAQNTLLNPGINIFTYDAYCLPKGIYLLEIISDINEIAYQRLIRQ